MLEQLGQRPVHDERARRLAQDPEHAVLAGQLLHVDRRLGADVRQLLGREDPRALGFAVLILVLPVVGRVGEDVLAQGDHVAVAELALVREGLPVQESAVLAVEVENVVSVAALLDLGVMSREPLVGQEDVALPGAPDGDARLGEREPLAGAVGRLDGDFGHTSQDRFYITAAPAQARRAPSQGLARVNARGSVPAPCVQSPTRRPSFSSPEKDAAIVGSSSLRRCASWVTVVIAISTPP